MRPDLEQWGILDAVEEGICPNTYENRKIIREHKARYQPVYQMDGAETDLIEVITAEMQEARARLTKSDLLVDHRNIDSDFITGLELQMLIGVEDIVPLWVIAATKHWRKVEKERENGNPKFRPALKSAPGRCRASKMDGHRCMMWHDGRLETDGLCKVHLGTHVKDETFMVNAQTRARNRLLSAAEAATEVLEELMASATSEPVRAQAAKEILDRAGVRAGMEIEIKGDLEVRPAKDLVAERIAMLAIAAQEKMAEEAAARAELEERTVDAEVVEESDDDRP